MVVKNGDESHGRIRKKSPEKNKQKNTFFHYRGINERTQQFLSAARYHPLGVDI